MRIAEIVAQMAEATTSAILIARSASLGARRMEINGTKPSITRDAAVETAPDNIPEKKPFAKEASETSYYMTKTLD